MNKKESMLKIKEYMDNNFSQTIKNFSELSKSNSEESLVESDAIAYCFDDIAEIFYPEYNKLASSDALYLNKYVNFIEFKPLNTNTKDALDAYQLIKDMPINSSVIENAKELLRTEVILNVEAKAKDSIKIFKDKIISGLRNEALTFETKFIWVINEKSSASIALANAYGKRLGDKSDIQPSLKIKLQRFKARDNDGNPIYYNYVDVWNTLEFNNKLVKDT